MEARDSVVVVDASPLILLSRANLLSLLRFTTEPVIVPDAVAVEIRAKGESDPTAVALRTTDWLTVVPPVHIPESIQNLDLGSGETSVLAWAATHDGTLAILDDRAARRHAAALDIPTLGTIGIVARAKDRGAIPFVRPALEQLRGSGMYISSRICEEVLRRVGE